MFLGVISIHKRGLLLYYFDFVVIVSLESYVFLTSDVGVFIIYPRREVRVFHYDGCRVPVQSSLGLSQSFTFPLDPR